MYTKRDDATVIKFTKNRDRLISGEKRQTIRTGYGKWARRITDATPLVDICWIDHDGTLTKLAHGTATVVPMHGYEFNGFTTVRDGYTSLEALHNELADIYDMSRREVFIYRWAVITWKRSDTFIYSGEQL